MKQPQDVTRLNYRRFSNEMNSTFILSTITSSRYNRRWYSSVTGSYTSAGRSQSLPHLAASYLLSEMRPCCDWLLGTRCSLIGSPAGLLVVSHATSSWNRFQHCPKCYTRDHVMWSSLFLINSCSHNIPLINYTSINLAKGPIILLLSKKDEIIVKTQA